MQQWLRTIGAMLLLGACAVQAKDLIPGPTSLVPRVTSRAVAPAIAPPGAAAHALEQTDVDSWLDGYMPAALRTASIPSAVVTDVKIGEAASSGVCVGAVYPDSRIAADRRW